MKNEVYKIEKLISFVLFWNHTNSLILLMVHCFKLILISFIFISASNPNLCLEKNEGSLIIWSQFNDNHVLVWSDHVIVSLWQWFNDLTTIWCIYTTKPLFYRTKGCCCYSRYSEEMNIFAKEKSCRKYARYVKNKLWPSLASLATS